MLDINPDPGLGVYTGAISFSPFISWKTMVQRLHILGFLWLGGVLVQAGSLPLQATRGELSYQTRMVCLQSMSGMLSAGSMRWNPCLSPCSHIN